MLQVVLELELLLKELDVVEENVKVDEDTPDLKEQDHVVEWGP